MRKFGTCRRVCKPVGTASTTSRGGSNVTASARTRADTTQRPNTLSLSRKRVCPARFPLIHCPIPTAVRSAIVWSAGSFNRVATALETSSPAGR
jgi:hypothetical protein